jgi:hypothetical protein
MTFIWANHPPAASVKQQAAKLGELTAMLIMTGRDLT